MWFLCFIVILFVILFIVGAIRSGIKNPAGYSEPAKARYESEKDRRFRIAREKWTASEIIQDTDKRWQLIVDNVHQCLVYSNELEYSDFVLKLSEMKAISFSRNFELAFSTYPVYKDKLDNIDNIIPEWLHGGRYLKKGIKNLSLTISYTNAEEDSCHIIDLFDIEEFDDRKRGVRDIDDWAAPHLIDAYQKGLRIYEIFLNEMKRRDAERLLQDPELPADVDPRERIKANLEFFQN